MTPAPSIRPPSALATPRRGQKGISMLGILFWLVIAGFFAMVGLKLLPIYLNQLKVTKAVEEAAKQAKGQGPDDVAAIKRALNRIWDVDDIEHIDAKDVVVARDGDGTDKRLMVSYDYEVRTNFAYNVDIVVHFKKSVPAGPAA